MALKETIRAAHEIWIARPILFSEVHAELKSGIAGSPVGYLWWFIEPLAMMLVFYFVLGIVFERVGGGYLMSVFTALVAWQWFAKSMDSATTAFTKSKKFVSALRFPLSVLVLSKIAVNFVYFAFGLLVVILVNYASVTPMTLYLPAVVFTQFVVMMGIGMLLATINVFVRDLERMMPVLLRALWFLSPVFYEVSDVLQSERIPEWGKAVFQLNPLSVLLSSYRSVILFGEMPLWNALAVWTAFGMVLIGIGGMVLRRTGGVLPKLI